MILEQACEALTLDNADYNLWHSNKALDLSLTIRFAMIPNNGLLELKKSDTGSRTESNVTIALQFESGQRKMGDFSPGVSLWDVISVLADGDLQVKSNQVVVAVYMQKETVGQEALASTTLRNLGLTSGRAALRVVCREEGSLGGQAHVESLVMKKRSTEPSVAAKAMTGIKKAINNISDSVSTGPSGSSKDDKKEANCTSGGIVGGGTSGSSKSGQNSTNAAQRALQVATSLFSKKPPEPQGHRLGGSSQETHAALVQATSDQGSKLSASRQVEAPVQIKNIPAVAEEAMAEVSEEDLKINWLGERNALIFTLDDIPKIKSSDESEEFFQITREDVVLMLDDLKRQMTSEADRPLETKKMREAREARAIEKYKKSVLRINFPSDKLVLQATFDASETIGAVIEFIRKFVVDPNLGFYIYVAPPKEVLQPSDTLVSRRLVPAAMVHVGHAGVGSILKPEVKDKTTSFEAISHATRKLRQQLHGIDPNSATSVTGGNRGGSSGHAEASGSQESETAPARPAASAFRPSSAMASESTSKVPKWFKLGK